MNPATRTDTPIARGVTKLREALAAIPPQHRGPVAAFWQALRGELKALLDQNTALRTGTTAARPPTTDSINDLRLAFDNELTQTGQLVSEDETSTTVEAIWDLPPDWVMSRLENDATQHQQASPYFSSVVTSCWLAGNAPAHRNGYQKKNLRNSLRPGHNVPPQRRLIGCQPWLHQLAIVAKGQGVQLTLTAGENHTHEVSHLCHTPGCFNPEHVVVELRAENAARNSCKGHVVVRAPDGTVINPCWHWRSGVRMPCLLPVVHLPRDGGGRHFDRVGTGGEEFRRR